MGSIKIRYKQMEYGGFHFLGNLFLADKSALIFQLNNNNNKQKRKEKKKTFKPKSVCM
jgi:hypothetical protein